MAKIKDLQRRVCVRLTTRKPHRLSLTPLALQPPASLPAGRCALEEAAAHSQVTTGTFSSWTLSFIVSHLLPSSLRYSITVPPWWLLPARCQLVSQPVIVTGTESSKTCQLPASLAQLPSLVQGEQHLKSSCHYSRATSLQRGPAELHTGSSYWQPQRRDLIYFFILTI